MGYHSIVSDGFSLLYSRPFLGFAAAGCFSCYDFPPPASYVRVVNYAMYRLPRWSLATH
jgi:hypothetical protein